MKVPGSDPTILVPGFFGGNMPFTLFRDALLAQGVAAACWKRSPIVYRRPIDWYGERLAEDLFALREAGAPPLTGVGWSEGGHILVSAMRHLSKRFDNPEDVVRRVITFGTPFDGTWAARVGGILDPILGLNVGEMRPGSPVIAAQVKFLHRRRRWKFHAVCGTRDLLIRTPQESLDQAWCQYGPWDHKSLAWHPGLFDLIHRLIVLP